LEWGWVVAGVGTVIAVSMWRMQKRNSDPIYHDLLSKLFSAARLTDDIHDDSFAMKTFVMEIQKIIKLDGGIKAGRKLAQVASMIPHYGDASPLVRSRATTIIDRIIRNGVSDIAVATNAVTQTSLIKGEHVLNDEVLNLMTLDNELRNQSSIPPEYKNIIKRHLRFMVGRSFQTSNQGESSAVLVLISKSMQDSNGAEKPKFSEKCFRITRDILLEMLAVFEGKSISEIDEAMELAAISIFHKKNIGVLPEGVVRAMLASAQLRRSRIFVEEDDSFRGTPICYCIHDKSDGGFYFFSSLSVSGRPNFESHETFDLSFLQSKYHSDSY
jgi:hypothetical protein